MAPSTFMTSSFVVDNVVLDLQSVLNERRGVQITADVLVSANRTPDLPMVSAPLKAGATVPSARKGAKPFELPNWSLATRVENGRTVPAAWLQWTGGVVEAGESVAIFEVALAKTYSNSVANGEVRRMDHSTSTVLRVPSRLGDAAGALSWDEWDSIATVLSDGSIRLSFELTELGDVQRLYRGMTGGGDSAQLVVTAIAPCVRRQQKVQVLDADMLHRFKHIGIPQLGVNPIRPPLPHRLHLGDLHDRVQPQPLPLEPGVPIGGGQVNFAGVVRRDRVDRSGLAQAGAVRDRRTPSAAVAPLEAAPIMVAGNIGQLDLQRITVNDQLLPDMTMINGVGPIVVGAQKTPAVVRSSAKLRSTVELDIVPELFPEVFSVPTEVKEAPEPTRFRRSVTLGARTVEYFEDALTPGLYYYRPDAFRLERLPQPPHQPSLVFAFVDEIRTRDDGTTELVTSVEVTFSITPSIDASTLRAVARQIAATHTGTHPAVLLPLSMGAATVELTLVGGDGSDVTISGEVTIRDGGTITLTMDDSTFNAVIARLQSPGPAIAGTVHADEGDVIVPLSCSFFEPSTGPIEADIEEGNIVLRNRSIGTVSVDHVALINRLDASELTLEVTAPEIQPGDVVTSTIPDGITVDSHLLAVSATIHSIPGIDGAAFWRPFAITRGHLSTGRDLSVSLSNPGNLASATFDPVLGQLTAIRFEIFHDTSLVLDANTPTRETRVRTDAIASLFPESQDDANAIMFRVVNVHGEVDGAVSGWTRTSASSLIVDPVAVA